MEREDYIFQKEGVSDVHRFTKTEMIGMSSPHDLTSSKTTIKTHQDFWHMPQMLDNQPTLPAVT